MKYALVLALLTTASLFVLSSPPVILSSPPVILSLSKDASAAETQGHLAYVDVGALQSTLRPQLAAYDREIAALKATQSVPQLSDTRGVVRRQAGVVKAGAVEARNTLAALRTTPPQPAAGSYRNALSSETATSLANFRAGLQARVESGYAARQQQFYEHEAKLQVQLERASADRRLALVLRMQNLKPPFANRAKLKAQIAAIDGRIARQVGALHASDQQLLAAYKARVEAQAASDYASMQSDMQRKAQANLQLHDRVARQTVRTTGAPRELQQAQFDAAGADISRRFSQIADADAAARGSAANQIIALQQDKAALTEEFRRSALAIASSIAQRRGLTLVDHPVAGATDLTHAVRAVLNGS
jgi:hypothetical protein